MDCGDLARTGLPLLSYLPLAGALLVGGLLLVRVRAGGRIAALTVAVLIACGGGALAGSGGATAQAAPSCDTATPDPGPAAPDPGAAAPDPGPAAEEPLRITQTSRISGLAPGVPPAAIAGTISNTGSESLFITGVRVSMVGVSLAPAAAAGVCDLSDYVVAGTIMDVGRTLEPGESAEFTGASIGFLDKSVNQDACQRAVVHFRYDSF